MDDLSPSDLKTILHSKRANIYYLQYCRVLVNGGRVEYVTEEGKSSLYWNIPIANTTVILLGTGTSVTQAAVRELAKAGVLLGFCGGGGTPLFAASEVRTDIEWLTSQSEYRPTEYLQQWCSFWFDEEKRLDAAKGFQQRRIQHIRKYWKRFSSDRELAFNLKDESIEQTLTAFDNKLASVACNSDLLAAEASTTKNLYRLAAAATGYGEFTRAKQGGGSDMANRFLDHGNYLAYGLAATACWVLGLPHGLAVLHGKTRRGGLVFDVADLIKDALVLPTAFIAATEGDDEQSYRQRLITLFQQASAIDLMIDAVKMTAEQSARGADR